MSKLERLSLVAGAACSLALLSTVPALAAAVSFVSVRGTDTGNCAAITTPCRTFAYALGQTSTHGEIFAIAPGNYGPVTITKSISLTGTVDGAGINTAAATTNGSVQISIAAGANDLVYLTGLTLDGSASPNDTRGVFISSAGRVIIRKCALRNYSGFDGNGVVSAGAARLLLQDDAVSNANDNIYVFSGPPVVIHRVSSVNARQSAIAIFAAGSMISESSLAGSSIGIFGGGSFLTRSAISGNFTGVAGSATTGGDNLIRGNATNVSGTLTNIGLR